MPNKIDYSKWDIMDFGSDDESVSSSEDNHRPTVTRLDEPSKVTFSAQGFKIEESRQTSPDNTTCTMTLDKSSRNDENTNGKIPNKLSMLTRNGTTFVDPDTGNVVHWSQDHKEVVLSIVFDHTSIASKDIRVETMGELKYEDRYSAVGSICFDHVEGSKGKLTVKAVGPEKTRIILQGYMAYPFHLPEGEEQVDWEIDTNTEPNMKMLRITLLKAVPMQGLTVWWSRPLLHFTEIDVVTGIEGRTKNGSNQVSSNHDEWKQAWDEAHRLFKGKIKDREKHIVNISEGEE
mmetsp:Transcript_2628/g.4900  ORF Transcript_2628/g.4900 Transcript_2628/m.4900 type:complete len:290 (-) Transcript_2628:466-1335(-)